MAREMKDFPSEEKKLEQYGVWVKVQPEDYGAAEPSESAFKLTDLETGGEPPQESFTKEEEELLDELETDMAKDSSPISENEDLVSLGTEPALTAETVSMEEGEVLPELDLDNLEESSDATMAADTTPVPDLVNPDILELPDEAFPSGEESETDLTEEILPAEIPIADEDQAGEIDVPLSEGSSNEEHFDDLAALEEELATVTGSTVDAAKPGEAVSGEVLARIEAELKSIRSDLTQLKKELTVLKKPSKAALPGKDQDVVGFFDEDEDETIALTGDELDNILSTAEITEGQVEAADAKEEKLLVEEPSEEEPALLDELPDALTAPEAGVTEPVSDLELESLGIEGEAPAEVPVTAAEEDLELEPLESADETGLSAGGDLEMELESLPELEVGGETAEDAVELESLEEEAQGETAPLDLESIPEFETAEPADDALSKAAEEAVAEEIDLEALAPEGEDAAVGLPAVDEMDLETGELEALPDGDLTSEDKGIEIAFEEGGTETGEEVQEAEEVLEAEPESEPSKPSSRSSVPEDLKSEIRTVLKYMDQLLEALPEEKIQEFASSEYFVMYKKLFEDLGLGE